MVQVHPVLAGMASIDAALKDLADVDPGFMTTAEKRQALLGLGGLVDAARFFKPWQRTAKQFTTSTCEAEGCEIPAAWCEAHHGRRPWAQGGKTDLEDLALLCSFHHHRAHDPHYDLRQRPRGGFTFHRRT